MTSSGKPISSGVPLGRTGTPAARAVSFAASLSPPARSAAGGGPTQVRPGLEHRLGELRALGEEPVAGVDGVGAGLPRGAHVLGRVEVGRDLDERVRRLGVERAAVVGSRDRDRLEPLGTAGAEDAERDLPRLATSRRRMRAESRLRLAERSGRVGGFALYSSSFDRPWRWNDIAVRLRLGVALLVAAVVCATAGTARAARS